MADGSTTRTDEINERVLLAVHTGFQHLEGFSGGLSLFPEHVARGRPKGQGARLKGQLHCLTVGVGDKNHLFGVGILHRHGNDVVLLFLDIGGDFGDLREVEAEFQSFFECRDRSGSFPLSTPFHRRGLE